MALHPFRTFQRNQKAWLAVIGIATMISFILLPVLLQLFSRGGSTLNTIAKCRSFGNVTNQSLAQLNDEREIMRRFMYVLYEKLADPNDETKTNSLRPLMQFVRQYDQRQDSDTLVNNWLLSQYAKQQGLRADWAVVSDLLKQLTTNYLTDTIYQDCLNSVGISHQRLEYLLGEEIVRQQLLERFQLSLEPISPATRWNWYQRLYRKVQIEAVAVPVEQFVGQVSEPSKIELKKFFEEHKKKHNDAASPETGFIEPAELAFQYVIAEANKKMLDSVTEDEIKKYYEENKDTLFVKPEQPAQQEKELPGLPVLGGAGVLFPAPQKPVAVKEQQAEPKKEGPKREEPKTEEPKKEETPKSAQPAVPNVTPAVTPQAEEPKQEEPKKTSMNSLVTAKLVKFQSPPAEQTDGQAAPAADAPKPDAKQVNDAATPAPQPAVQFVPFDEVKDEIRKVLARQKASALLPKIQEKMKEYAKVYNEHFEAGKQVPPIPDLSKLAADNDLLLKIVPAGTLFQTLKNEFARDMQERQRLVGLYAQSPMPFDSEVFSGSRGDVLIWITNVRSERKPEKFEDVESAVVKRWKEVQARIPAKESAEKLAAETKLSQKSLAETFKGREGITVVETEPFSWKTYGAGIHPLAALMQGMRPVLDEVREQGVAVGNSLIDNKVIDVPGGDFMKSVFSLSVGETAVAFNQPETVVYVVRIKSSTPSEDVLWDSFQAAYPLEYVYAGQPEESADAYRAWLDHIYESTGFTWERKPDDFEP
ncbi:MAG: SurA N-terminal domain-containing protein [Planctomycetaceae bacterium]|jgi:hypothetical protein|nr:SurA N-terminal domain-containing protein [Planctomycetaceae bacterium]